MMSPDVTWCHCDATLCHSHTSSVSMMSLGVTVMPLSVTHTSSVTMMSLGVTWCHSHTSSVSMMSLDVSMMSLGVTQSGPCSVCTVPFGVLSGCSDPYDSGEEGSSPQPTKVDIDLELTAFANARRCAVPCPRTAMPHPHLCCAPPTHQVLPPQVACS